MPIHDLRCTSCDYYAEYQHVKVGEYGRCPDCHEPLTWAPAQLNTDVHEPEYYEATGQYHQSQREATRAAARQTRDWNDRVGAQRGLKLEVPIECGDPVGGARVDLSIKDSGFSYAGQRNRRSSGERSRARKRSGAHPKPQEAERDDYRVSGIEPRRGAGEVQRERESKTYTGRIEPA